MLTHTELKKGETIIVDGQPYLILDAFPQRYAQRKLMIQTKLRNLVSGGVISRTVHQGETFEEADLEKLEAKFIYQNRGKFIFCEAKNPSKRFELTKEQIGDSAGFLKSNEIIEGIIFDGKIITVSLPIKVQLKVVEAPPGVKGERAQSGTKIVKLESGAEINAPLFIGEGDVIEVNTETHEYVKRV